MTVVAKFKADTVTKTQDGHTYVRMHPVYHENDPDHPNRKFWEATPSGELSMYITNPPAGDYFVDGGVYTLTFVRDDDTDQAATQPADPSTDQPADSETD
jgi:hypothetical protein